VHCWLGTTIFHIPGPTNPADILSKHWDMASVWQMMRPFLFHWRGEDPAIDAIKMLIKQVQHAKVANVLATEG
jgi:hypothetical protein